MNGRVREGQRRVRNFLDQRTRLDWPALDGDGSVIVIGVSYNTLTITLQMIFSMYRVLDQPPMRVIIVDNGSTDGSAEFLSELHELGLIFLVRNRSSNQHGPGLNVGMRVASKMHPRASLVWVVDSDVFVARADALVSSRLHLAGSGHAMIGPRDGSGSSAALPDGYAHVSCLLFDPRQIWRGRTPVFHDHGDPGRPMQEWLQREGRPAGFFPFYDAGYAVHLGRATLMHVASAGEIANPLYSWAVTHNVHHYAGYEHGPELHRRIGLTMHEEVGEELTAQRFADACRRGSRIELSAGL